MNTAVPVLLFLNAIVGLALTVIGGRRRDAPGGLAFVVMMVAVVGWSLVNAVQILATDPSVKRVLAQSAYLFIVATIVGWWWCCVDYSGRARLVTPARLALAAAPGVISLVLIALGNRTTLMWTDLAVAAGHGPVAFPAGPWFTVHSLWAFALVLGGVALLARTVLRAAPEYRSQLLVFLIAIVVPLVVNGATVQTGLIDTGGHDFTPIALLVSGATLGLGLLRLGLLDLLVGLVPGAHDSVIESMRDGVVVVGPNGRILEANPAASALLREVSPAIGTPVEDVLPAWRPGRPSELDVSTDDDVRTIELTSSELRGAGHVITLRDVTEARAAERALRESFARATYQAQHDHLTGLPNRRHLFDCLADQTGEFALVILDLDGFKGVNDAYGHGAGDDALAQLARRLRAASRPDTVVARLAGDEFALLLPGATERSAELAARVAVDALSAPIMADGHEVVLAASAGVALAPVHATDADEIVRAADVAMYAAKRSQDRVAIYGEEDDARSPNRVLLVQELRRALAFGELTCHYQPQVRTDGSVRGVEALIRWHHPERGLLRPAAFLAAAEQGGLMRQIADRVLELASADLQTWQRAGRDWTVGVNLSADDLRDPALPHRVAAALARTGVSPDRLTVEVTESAVFESEAGARALGELRVLGVAVSLDDFGTGYGPLAHLRELPIDELKLDRSFVAGLTRDRRDAALVAGQIRIGHDLGLVVVAEGVESAACATRLSELQCDVLQGYHVGMPQPAVDLAGDEVSIA